MIDFLGRVAIPLVARRTSHSDILSFHSSNPTKSIALGRGARKIESILHVLSYSLSGRTTVAASSYLICAQVHPQTAGFDDLEQG